MDLDIIKKLKKTELFFDIEEKDIIKYFTEIKYEIKKYSQGENIAFRGDEVKGLHINLEGKAATEMLKESGEVKRIEEINSFSLLATAFIFGNKNRFPVDLNAITSTSIFYIEKDELIQLLKKDDRLLKRFLDEISCKAQFLSNHLWNNFTNKTIGEKFSQYILENQRDGFFQMKISVKDLAEYFDVSRPSLSRVIKIFLEENILEKIEKGRYKIIDMDRLRAQ
ncbi:Crp/Fnr family transcriptional regulator [uncultured Fusobacterium sp.]|uniref:Crp/Fnr family transcriptional regulator n=1 Tax=uncultured Fusobacterium sp. TaxID=159267 RepID=UPI000BBAD5F4|nr:Crp/Fnr family transcriptional regulator [uncultured Fusobacterium sp.]BBA50037.1 putative cAMP-binding protein [Fusobacterium varium]